MSKNSSGDLVWLIHENNTAANIIALGKPPNLSILYEIIPPIIYLLWILVLYVRSSYKYPFTSFENRCLLLGIMVSLILFFIFYWLDNSAPDIFFDGTTNNLIIRDHGRTSEEYGNANFRRVLLSKSKLFNPEQEKKFSYAIPIANFKKLLKDPNFKTMTYVDWSEKNAIKHKFSGRKVVDPVWRDIQRHAELQLLIALSSSFIIAQWNFKIFKHLSLWFISTVIYSMIPLGIWWQYRNYRTRSILIFLLEKFSLIGYSISITTMFLFLGMTYN